MVSGSTRRASAAPEGTDADRGFVVLAGIAGSLVAAFAAATLVGTPDALLSTAFAVAVSLVAPCTWWAFQRVPADLRVIGGCLAGAATLWLVGSLSWYYRFAENGYVAPRPAGLWEAFFVAAYAVALVTLYAMMRREISLRRAALNASVVAAAGIALGAAVAGHQFERGVTGESLVTVVRPLLGVVVLALVASAALGRGRGLPLWVALFALGQLFVTVGGIVYSYEVVGRQSVDLRWAQLALFPGAVVSILSATALALGMNRPVAAYREKIPGHRVGAPAVLYSTFGGLAVTLAVAFYGHLNDDHNVLWVGIAASAWIGIALAVVACSSIRALEQAYERLDHAHVALEHTKDRFAAASEELARTNVELRSIHAAFEGVLVIADERTSGGLRELVEDAGEDLAGLLSDYLDRRDR